MDLIKETDFMIDDFAAAAEPQHREFVMTVHEKLTACGYKMKIEKKTNGLFVSYSHPKTKRSALNLFFRKKGLFVRLYPDGITGCGDILNSLSESMVKEIDKALLCKRLINPDECNPKCIMGYDFNINGKRFIKCRYMCFKFAVTEESKYILTEWINKGY